MFQVIHARKIPTQVGLKNVLAHNARENEDNQEFKNPDWKPDGLHKNGEPSDKALAMRTAQLQGLKRKPQKNASKAIEFNISAGEGFTDWKNYFQDAKKFLAEKYGAENIISTAVHTDETTPHMHCVFVPILRDKNGNRKYSSSDFLGGRNGLAQLQTEFYERVGKKYGLERGIEGSRATHSDVADFKRKKKALEDERKRLSDERERLSERSKTLEAQIMSVNAQIADFQAVKKSYDEKIKFDNRAAAAVEAMIDEGRLSPKSDSTQLFGALKTFAKKYKIVLTDVARVLTAPLAQVEEMCRRARLSGFKTLSEYLTPDMSKKEVRKIETKTKDRGGRDR